MFRDEEFADACLEISTPSLSKYEIFSESYDKKIRVFKANEKDPLVNSYKMFGVLDTPPNICAEAVLDLDYRKKWDPYLKGVNVIANNSMKAIYCLTTLPFPLSNRDYVYVQEMRELMYNNKHYWVILSMVDADLNNLVPAKKGVVRLESCFQAIALTSDGNKGCKAFCSYSESSTNKIPSWFLNWVAQKGLPSFLDKMLMACDNYAKTRRADSRRMRTNTKDYHCGSVPVDISPLSDGTNFQ